MSFITTKLFTLLLIWLIDKSYGLQDFSVPRFEYSNGDQVSFYYYASDNPKPPVNNINKFSRHTPRIIIDNSERHEQNTKIEVANILSASFATLQYQPVVILVDDSCEAFLNAEFFTNYLLSKQNVKNEFWLMKFNASGVSTVLSHSRTYSEEFEKHINEGLTKPRNTIISNESTTFFAILKAAQILPKNSAILIFANVKPLDEDLAQLALTTLMQKQIRLYAVWSGPSKRNEEKLLEETSIYTHGTFFVGYYFNLTSTCKKVDTSLLSNIIGTKEEILIKRKVFNYDKIQIPIDLTVKHLHFIIEGDFRSATLTLPDDYNVNLLDLMSVRRLAPGSTIAHELGRWAHIRFNTAKVTSKQVAGIWKINIHGLANNTNGYNLTVYSETDISISSKLVQIHKAGSLYSSKSQSEKEIQLDINGNVKNIENITIIDNNSHEVFEIPVNFTKNMKIKNEFSNEKYNLRIPQHNNITFPNNSFHIQVTGTTNQGEIFSRLSYVEQNRQTKNLPMIFIETSIRSELLATAGSNPKIIFEVTNNYDRPIFVPFSVQDEKSMLRDLQPRSAVIAPKGTVEVTVYTIIPSASSLQYTDLITLTALGEIRAQKSVMLYVNSVRRTDSTLPYLNYKFTSTCMEVPYSSCQSGIWSIEVTAQDSETGLLRVVSEPVGLYSPNGYISGTKESVITYYSSTCCQPYLDITAVDLNNNKKTYKIDAYNATLSTGSIVAVVLGSILLIIIIIVIAVLINKKCKKRDSLDLPRYRSQTRISRF